MSLKRRSTVQDELLPGSRQNLGTPPPRRRRRQGPLINPRKLLRIAAYAALSVVVVYGGLTALINGERLRPQVETKLSAETGRHVEVRSLTFSVRHFALIAGDVTISEDPAFGGPVPFLQARTISMRVAMFPLLFFHEVKITGVTLDNLIVVLRQGASGDWNYYSLLHASNRSVSDLDPASIEVTNGRLSVTTFGDDSHTIGLHDAHFSSPALSVQMNNPFTLTANVEGGGTLKMEGRVGPMEWDHNSPMVPVSGLAHAANLNLAALLSNSPSVSGQLSFDASLESDGRILRMDGQAKAVKMKLAGGGEAAKDNLQAVFTLAHDLNTHNGTLNHCDFRVDKGSAALTGKYATAGRSVLMDLKLAISDAPVTSLAQFLPALGFRLPGSSGLVGGAVVGDLTVEGALEEPAITGSLSVNGARLTGFDLSQRLAPVEGLDASDLNTEIEIVSWKSRLKSSGAGMNLEDLTVAVAGLGSLSGSGTIAPDGGLNFKMSGIRGLTGPKGISIPFTVGGTCAAPEFRPAR